MEQMITCSRHITNNFVDDGFSIFAVMKWDQGGAKGHMLSKSDSKGDSIDDLAFG